jgi:diaminopimelate decarboxylase
MMGIWPLTAQPAQSVGGVRLAEIAEHFGTPAYVLDEEHVRGRCREYRKVMAPHEVAYASKAFWCRAMARWVAEEDLSLDVCSDGELVVASAAKFPADRILLHGNGKTRQELSVALDYGVGRVVVDSAGEVGQLAGLAALAGRRQKVLVRVTPAVDAHVHPAVTTGTEDQKFGLSIASGEATHVARRIRREPSLELVGAHCHIGSQISSLEGFETAARRMVAFMAGLGGLPELNLGGGHAVPYRPGHRGLRRADHRGRRAGMRSARHCGATPHGRAGPGDRRLRRGDAVPGGHRETRRPYLRRGGRRLERQPAASTVRQPVPR